MMTGGNTTDANEPSGLPVEKSMMHVRSLSSDGAHARSLSSDAGADAAFAETYSDDEMDGDFGSDDGSDDGEVPHTHDVIISEIEDINLQDYMRTLEAPVFDERAALADEFFGFGAGAFIRAAGGDDCGENGVGASAAEGGLTSESDSERVSVSGALSPTASLESGAADKGETMRLGWSPPPDAVTKPETLGRAGRRGWSRQGTRGGNGAGAGDGSDVSGGTTFGEERPATGGLNEKDCARGGFDSDGDADGDFAGINADIYDDSDDDENWGDATHHALEGRAHEETRGEMSDDEPAGDATGDAAGDAREHARDANGGAFGDAGTELGAGNGLDPHRFGWGDDNGVGVEQRDASESQGPSLSRVRRRPLDDDFVVMSTPKGLRRVPSARKIRSSQGGRPGAGSNAGGSFVGGAGAGHHDSAGAGNANAGVGGHGEKTSGGTSAPGTRRRAQSVRASSASGVRASAETTRRLEMLQRPPSRQRPPPEAVDLFARGRAAAAAAAAAPAVPGLNKVSRPAGMAASMLRM